MQIKAGSVTSTAGGVWVNPYYQLRLSTEFRNPNITNLCKLLLRGKD
jgi:hypothetical protein